MTMLMTFSEFADDALLDETIRLAVKERVATGHLIAALAEVDARKLYLGEGFSSLFVYCTRVLHLSEHAAYSRIEAARAARRFPAIIQLLIDGAVTLTSVTLLAPHLSEENHRALLQAACHKSKREIEVQVAALRPQAPVPSSIRKVSTRQPAAPLVAATQESSSDVHRSQPSAVPATPRLATFAVVKPLAPEHYKIQFTISRDTHAVLRRVQDLLRHSIPDGDPAKIFEKALALLLADAEKKQLAAALKPRDSSEAEARATRHVPANVKRAVWERDGGRCAFVGKSGRCEARGFLEFHHLRPFAAGGATTLDNLELRCRAHNAYEAQLFFGPLIAREARPDFGKESTRSGPS